MKLTKSAEPTVFVPDHIDCEMWGQGGSFIVGADGKRVRVPDEVQGEVTGDGTGTTLPPIDAANSNVERTAPAIKKGAK